MRKTALVILLLFVAAIALTACGSKAYDCQDAWGCAEFKKGESVQVAYVGPMTGDYSAFGIDISRGAELAIAENPTIKGFEVELVTEDTQGSPEGGAAVANKLAADPKVIGVDGHTFSGSTEVAIPIYEDAGVVMVSPSTTLVNLPSVGPNVYNRVAFSDKIQGEMAADYVYNSLGIRTIVGVHDGGAYGKGLVEVMAAAFEGLGGSVLDVEAITPGETDYSAILAAIGSLGPELIYFGGYDADGAVLVSQMAGAGLQDVLFFGCDGTYGSNFLELAGSSAEGAYSTYVPIPPSDAFEQFKADYESAYGDPQGKLSPFSPHGHDAMALILAAANEVAIEHGDSLIIPRKALADAVRGVHDYEALTGVLNCAGGECAAAQPVFMIAEGSAWVELPGQ